MSSPLLNNTTRIASHIPRTTTRSPLASTSRLTLSSPTHQFARSSHIGSAPLYLSPKTTLTIQPFPPHLNPARPLSPALQTARSVLVKGPLGECRIPLHKGVDLALVDSSPSAAPVSAGEEESIRYDVILSDASPSQSKKKLAPFWGLTRALLQNALQGVSEGHSLALKLVGVGYRAAVEADPTPRLSKLQQALNQPAQRTFFTSTQQEEAYRALAALQDRAARQQQRLVLRLGYSHPIVMPVPTGLTVATPQPTRIVVKGVDKEAVGLFASQIRAWRPPEPYKGKGVFVGDETIRLKSPRKK